MTAPRLFASSISTRFRQTLRFIRPRSPGPGAIESARNLLDGDQWKALIRLNPFDQWHSFCVYCELTSAEVEHRDVLIAGLLHDIGKYSETVPIRFWDRSLYVLVSSISPRIVLWIANRWPRSAQAVLVDHPVRGATLARQLGCSPATTWLIENHADGMAAVTGELALLRQADRAC